MAHALKYATAGQVIHLGKFLGLDGNTPATALTIANTDIKLTKNGATSEVSKNSGGATHMFSGVYHATLDATDTDTPGPMTVWVHVATALYVKLECIVLPPNVHDSTISATDVLDVNVTQWLGTAPGTPTVAGVPEVDLTHVGGSTTDVAALATTIAALVGSPLADSIPADGTRASLTQAVYMILQLLTEMAVSGTTVTVKKVDGSTTLFTLGLDDGTNPTSITRS